MNLHYCLQLFGDVINTGHDLTIYMRPKDAKNELPLITGGPLTYKYRVHRLVIHFGGSDDIGSEHRIAGKAFPLEVRNLHCTLLESK